MPCAKSDVILFGDGDTIETSTEVGELDVDGDGCTVTPVTGYTGGALAFTDRAALKVKLEAALVKVAAAPSAGFEDDIVNVPGNDDDPEKLRWLEDSGKFRLSVGLASQTILPGTVEGLVLALDLTE